VFSESTHHSEQQKERKKKEKENSHESGLLQREKIYEMMLLAKSFAFLYERLQVRSVLLG
jgi:hypothetical protein